MHIKQVRISHIFYRLGGHACPESHFGQAETDSQEENGLPERNGGVLHQMVKMRWRCVH